MFAYLKNLPLIASFFGIGLGMMLGEPKKWLLKFFPLVTLCLFLIITYAEVLNLTHVPFPDTNYLLMGRFFEIQFSLFFPMIRFLIIVLEISTVIVLFFTVIGGYVGKYLAQHPPLQGYGINLFGSIAGIICFTILSYMSTPPIIWVIFGLCAILPFFIKKPLAIIFFLITIFAIGFPAENIYWSPYYRISLIQVEPLKDYPKPTLYGIDVNYDYHQKMVDLSEEFISTHSHLEPYASAYATYELPYIFIQNPENVLIVGAGSGNDVASAIRNGARHIDAVEIDPLILELGKKYHPEKPYSSDRVNIFNDDARAFFHKTKKKYDLIIFAYLDSHTLLSSFSSVRLDDFIYTRESFQEARKLLKPGGTLISAFAGGNTFVTHRLYKNIKEAFGKAPVAYLTKYDSAGVVFVETEKNNIPSLPYPNISQELEEKSQSIDANTDRWPFLYLKTKSIPPPIIFTFIIFIAIAFFVLKKTTKIAELGKGNSVFFLLGAGFLLMETKAITDLSLLFGSTWVVNTIVIGSFLVMGLIANIYVAKKKISIGKMFIFLCGLIVVNTILSYSLFSGLPSILKIIFSGITVGLPVFFSGIIFSSAFKNTQFPSHALGINLFGAITGGVLENTVMIGGNILVGFLALIFYLASAYIYLRHSRGNTIHS